MTKTSNRKTTTSRAAKTNQKTGFLQGMSIFGLEYGVAMAALVILLGVLSVDTYALMAFINEPNPVSTSGGYAALWTAASTIVWLPVFIIFYLRFRAHMAQNPKLASNTVVRTFTIIFQVTTMLTVIGFAFAAVYSLFLALANAKETSELIVGSTLPAALSVLIWAWGYAAFFKKPLVSRSYYVMVVTIASVLIVTGTVTVSIAGLRYANEHSNSELPYPNSGQYYDRYDSYKDSYQIQPRSGY